MLGQRAWQSVEDGEDEGRQGASELGALVGRAAVICFKYNAGARI